MGPELFFPLGWEFLLHFDQLVLKHNLDVSDVVVSPPLRSVVQSLLLPVGHSWLVLGIS